MRKFAGRPFGATAPVDIQLAVNEALTRWSPGELERLTGLRRGTLAAVAAGMAVSRRTVLRARAAVGRLGWSRERLAYTPTLVPNGPELIGDVLRRVFPDAAVETRPPELRAAAPSDPIDAAPSGVHATPETDDA